MYQKIISLSNEASFAELENIKAAIRGFYYLSSLEKAELIEFILAEVDPSEPLQQSEFPSLKVNINSCINRYQAHLNKLQKVFDNPKQ